MLDYTSELSVRLAEREREVRDIALASELRGETGGVRASFAAGLVRLARALHGDAAQGAVLRPGSKGA